MATTYLSRTLANSNQKTWTLSVWVKRSKISSGNHSIIGVGGGGNYASHIYFQSDDRLDWWIWNGGAYAGRLITTRKFRDTSGYYHLVFALDTTSGTSGNRMRIYVNGVEETVFDTDTKPSADINSEINSASVHQIGANLGTGIFDGLMSHCYFCDGTALAPTVFGETDTTTGEWKIKTSPDSYTLGTNGFTILKDGNTITDQSSNSNDFTLGAGTLTKTEDNPSNVFATLNPLATSSYTTLSKGNTKSYGDTSSDNGNSYSTLAPNSGKYYVEAKIGAMNSNYPRVGIKQINTNTFGRLLNSTAGIAGYSTAYEGSYQSDAKKYSDNSATSWGSTYGAGDIISIALDCDNGACYMAKNGTWQESGNPTSGGSKTGAFLTWTPADVDGHAIAVADWNGSNCQFNFGNGYFDTTAVSSAGTNASGNGIFEYDVPTGYTALSTKGLNL